VLTAVLAVVAGALTVVPPPRVPILAPFAREATLISGLYALWQLAGTLSVLGTTGAFARGDWLERTERAWHLPSEASVQRAFIHDGWIIQGANIYYATMHFGVLFVFLIWLFVRHRDRYAKVRRVLALTTLVCLAIQLVPVAPPRLLSGYGYVDTAEQYGQSVYSLGLGADQLSAMPSVHVAWAVLIAWAAARIGRGPWRWLGTAHAVVTVFVVVVTANHFWADGVVAVGVLAVCAVLEEAASRVVGRLRQPAAEPATLAEAGAWS
jgi:PAP2 superfamily